MRSEEKVYINKRLRQRCSLSPLLLIICMVRMEIALEKSNFGFNLVQTGWSRNIVISQKHRNIACQQ